MSLDVVVTEPSDEEGLRGEGCRERRKQPRTSKEEMR